MRKKYDPREFQRQLERRNEAARAEAAEFAKARAEPAAAAEEGGAATGADAPGKPRHAVACRSSVGGQAAACLWQSLLAPSGRACVDRAAELGVCEHSNTGRVFAQPVSVCRA